MSREDIFNYIAPTMDIYRSLEVEIFRDITKRLKRTGEVNITQWQLEALREFGMVNQNVIQLLSDYSGLATYQIEKAIEDSANLAIVDVDTALKPYLGDRASNVEVNNILNAYKNQTFLEINNHVNQTLISTNHGHGTLARMFNDIVDKTTANYIVGNMTFHQALERTILEWTSRGIQSTFVDKGGHIWSMERYLDIVLKSTFNRTYNDLRLQRMNEFDVHTVIMGTVPDAAERCARCQGQMLDMRPTGENISGYISIFEFGYGEPDGTQGIGCRHPLWPSIPGVSVNNQPQIDPEESIRKSKIRNKQRELERRIRGTKKRLIVLEELGSDKVDMTKSVLRRQQSEIRELVKDADWLNRNYKNEKVYTPKHLLLQEYSKRPYDDFGERAFRENWNN